MFAPFCSFLTILLLFSFLVLSWLFVFLLSFVFVVSELGGAVTAEECRTLADYLTPSVGGLYLLPGVCSGLLEANDAKLAKVYEKENAEVYARLKKRNSVVAKADYPPTMC